VVHEDEDVVVVDKPAGLLTAPTPDERPQHLAACSPAAATAPAGVRRSSIDLDTSGLLVFARTADANRHPVGGLSPSRSGARVPASCRAVADGLSMVDRRWAGARGHHLQVAERLGTLATVVRARLETGRTTRFAFICGPAAPGAATKYGAPPELGPPRMALHATRLAFAHPRTGAALDFTSPWPPIWRPARRSEGDRRESGGARCGSAVRIFAGACLSGPAGLPERSCACTTRPAGGAR